MAEILKWWHYGLEQFHYYNVIFLGIEANLDSFRNVGTLAATCMLNIIQSKFHAEKPFTMYFLEIHSKLWSGDFEKFVVQVWAFPLLHKVVNFKVKIE